MRESSSLEFKREPSGSYLKTVSAFANYGTGKIIFGVDDEGEVVGVDDPRKVCLDVENAVNDSLVPIPLYKLEVDESNRTVTLTVFEGKSKPYLASGKAYRRADSSTVAVSRLEYGRLAMLGMNVSFDSLESRTQDLSFRNLESDLIKKTGLQVLDRNGLVSLELLSPDGLYNNAAALLADENDFYGVDIARFGESINVILLRKELSKASVLSQMEEALDVFDEYYAYEEIDGFERVSKTLIPRNAFREAVANALVHRRWDLPGGIKVSMYADRIEVCSPGGLPDGITEEEYVSNAPSVSRNPILANVFYRLGYIERFGTGIPRIIEEYSLMTVEPRFVVREASITVVLPVDNAVNVSQEERKILSCLPKGVLLPRTAIEKASGMSKDRTIRLLGSLMDKQLVVRQGSGRSTVYSRG